ncbi:deoxynucleoside kinase [Nocardioides sp. 616]|uniref:deoxynucleoside kinase n=1 Tax=Nocardioides sp. 616 TaxID=2268090 RepID=UPI001F0603B6|nr:deoxynucleoside kinase [Nocardioides sp. 616]
MSTDPDVVAHVLALAASRHARLGAGRLICIDGPAGSGKTTLAATLAAATQAPVVHLDELLDGWDGSLDGAVAALVSDVLEPLAAGTPASYHRYDWLAGGFAARVPVPASSVLVVEGVAAGSGATAPFSSALVWVEAAHDVRMRRGLARDGDAFAPHWDAWAAKEHEHFARERTRDRADLVLTTG